MRNTVQALAEKLVNCDSVEDLQHSHAYIEALNMGQV